MMDLPQNRGEKFKYKNDVYDLACWDGGGDPPCKAENPQKMIEWFDYTVEMAALDSNGNFYNDKLKNIQGVELMDYTSQLEIPYWIYTIKVKNRQEFMKYMDKKNIVTSRVHERNDIHSAVSNYVESLPNLDKLIDEMVCIPVGWWVSEESRDYIVECIKEFYS